MRLQPLNSQRNLRKEDDRTPWHRHSLRRLRLPGKALTICPSRPQSSIAETLPTIFRILMAHVSLSHLKCPLLLVRLLLALFLMKRMLICQHVHTGYIHQPIIPHLLAPPHLLEAALRASARSIRPAKKGQIYFFTLQHRHRLRIQVSNHLVYSPLRRHPRTIRRFLRP